MKAAATFRMKGRVVLRHIGEDHLLVPVSGDAARENCVFPLNETGVFLWERLSAGQSVDETARALTASFEVPLEEARADCRTFMQDLLEQQLLEQAAS